MNIEKLAKHLKEFTLDEIELIAECNCETALKQLLKSSKIAYKNGLYKYIEKKEILFDIFATPNNVDDKLTLETAVKYFLENYALPNCSKRTYETYFSIFKIHIIPFFRDMKLNDIFNSDIAKFYQNCEKRNLGSRRLKNTLTQLNQLIKYFQNQGVIDKKCVFQVKRLTDKNKYSFDRLIIGEERN